MAIPGRLAQMLDHLQSILFNQPTIIVKDKKYLQGQDLVSKAKGLPTRPRTNRARTRTRTVHARTRPRPRTQNLSLRPRPRINLTTNTIDLLA